MRIALVALLLACGTKRMSTDLITKEEVAVAAADLSQRVSQEMPCDRKVLGSDPLPGSAVDDQLAVFALVEKDPRELTRAVHRAVAHASACSAFATTHTGTAHAVPPDSFHVLAHAIASNMTNALATDPHQGFDIARDGVRLFQDLRRGRVAEDVAQLALAGERTILSQLIAAPWSNDVGGALGIISELSASEPEVGVSLQGALDARAYSRPELEPDQRDALWIAVYMLRDATKDACPVGSYLTACSTKLKARAPAADWQKQSDAFTTPFNSGSRGALRDRAVGFMRDETLADFIDHFAASRAEVLALMAVVSVRLELGRNGDVCPPDNALSESPWADLRAPRVLGHPVKTRVVDDRLEVSLPDWLQQLPHAGGLTTWSFLCARAP